MSNKKVAMIIIGIIALYAFLFQGYYFTHVYIPTHDFKVSFNSPFIVVNYLLNGFLALWSPERNAGFPVWTDSEVYPGYDPVSLVVTIIYGLLKSNIIYAHIVTVFFWHVIFAFGSFLLFRKLGLSKIASLSGFTILLFSTLTAMNFRQTDDYVTIYRYVPLLLFSIITFLQNSTIRNSIFMGLIAGLSLAGYQTPNILLLLIFAFIAAIPFYKNINKNLILKAIPGAVIFFLIASPFLLAMAFWLQNVTLCRMNSAIGYRGGLSDILGPLSRTFPDETPIYIGLIPFTFAFLRLAEIIKDQFSNKKISYWPSLYILVFGIITWIMYIGVPEIFTGVNKPFFFIRSFNNMYPYITLILTYFACEYINKIENSLKNTEKVKLSLGILRKNIIPILFLGGIFATILTELSRFSIITRHINSASINDSILPRASMVAIHFPNYLHGTYLILFSILLLVSVAFIIALITGAKRKLIVFFAILTIIDLTCVNSLLLNCFDAQLNTLQIQQHELRPFIAQKKASMPPMFRREVFDLTQVTFWSFLPEEMYNVYAVRTEKHSAFTSTWFQTKEFFNFENSIKDPKKFAYLTGISRPVIYFANSVIFRPDNDILPTLNNLSLNDLKNSIVVYSNGFSSKIPVNLPKIKDAHFNILKYTPNSIEIKVNSNTPVYLVYLDSWTKDWRAYLDNKRIPVLKVNYMFKSAFVPQGEHMLEFKYKPYPYIFALLARFVGIIGAVLFLAFQKSLFLNEEGKNE